MANTSLQHGTQIFFQRKHACDHEMNSLSFFFMLIFDWLFFPGVLLNIRYFFKKMDQVNSHSNENKPSSEEKWIDVGGHVLGKKSSIYGRKNALLKKARRRSNLQV